MPDKLTMSLNHCEDNSHDQRSVQNLPVVVCALYKFVALADFASLRDALYALMQQVEVRGTILLAAEGINGTIAGSRAGIDQVLAWLTNDHIHCQLLLGLLVGHEIHCHPEPSLLLCHRRKFS